MNKEEFKSSVDKIVKVDDIRFMKAEYIYWKVPLPKTNEEFKIFTKKYYGVELNCKVVVFDEGVTYKIIEKESEYSKGELYQQWEEMFSQYDGLKVLLDALFGDLSCGGVASHHYGQTKLGKDKCDWVEIKSTPPLRERSA